MNSLLSTAALAVLIASPVQGAPDSAAPDGPRSPSVVEDAIAVAKAKVLEGQTLYDHAQYEAALAAFQDAAAAYASPDFQFNIGLCYERLGESNAAIRAFETYLRNDPDASDRASVEHRVAQLRRGLTARSPLTTTPPATVVRAASSPQPRVVPVDIPLAPRGGGRLVAAGAALVGIGASLAVGGGIGFGIPATNRARRVEDVLVGGNPQQLTKDETTELAREGDRHRWLQISAVGIGVLGAVVGAALLAKGAKRKRTLGGNVGRSSAAVTWRLRF